MKLRSLPNARVVITVAMMLIVIRGAVDVAAQGHRRRGGGGRAEVAGHAQVEHGTAAAVHLQPQVFAPSPGLHHLAAGDRTHECRRRDALEHDGVPGRVRLADASAAGGPIQKAAGCLHLGELGHDISPRPSPQRSPAPCGAACGP